LTVEKEGLVSQHPAVLQVVEGFAANELHAARAGRMVMDALAQVAADSPASSLGELISHLEEAVDALLAVMPAYAPPLNVMHRMMALVDASRGGDMSAGALREALTREAALYQSWSQAARAQIAQHAANLIPQDGTVFTFTLSETMANTLASASRQGKRFSVLVTESRPNDDGRITVEKMVEASVPVSISIDACVGELVPQADLMMVGAEAIMAGGSAVCKVGTYPAALVAHTHGVPVYVVVDTMKFNATSVHGLALHLDGIQPGDVMDTTGMPGAEVVGHLFDHTPAELIAGIVTERGILNPTACTGIFDEIPTSATLGSKLQHWTHDH
jgi:translation initiation factor 2B subunit (eIF-2B alpha/beta/delta family)